MDSLFHDDFFLFSPPPLHAPRGCLALRHGGDGHAGARGTRCRWERRPHRR
jgi:hypothetical protein